MNIRYTFFAGSLPLTRYLGSVGDDYDPRVYLKHSVVRLQENLLLILFSFLRAVIVYNILTYMYKRKIKTFLSQNTDDVSAYAAIII